MTYNIRLFTSSLVLDQALATGRLLLDRSMTCPGLEQATVYSFADPEDEIQPQDPFGVKICGVLHQANLFTLPTAEYGAFTTPHLQYATWDTTHLVQLLLMAAPALELEQELTRIITLDKACLPAPEDIHFNAVWLPEQTRLCRDTSGWTLVVAFETATSLLAHQGQRSCHGIDVGIRPLAAVANSYSDHWQLPGLASFGEMSLGEQGRQAQLRSRLRHLALYKAAQQQFESLISRLLCEANAVVVEKLSLDELRKRTGHKLDDRAVVDFLYALLPQRLHLARIPLIRHPAPYTSRMCHRCYSYGLRQLQTWNRLWCANCDMEHDANENAARVLAQVGSVYALQRLRQQLGGEPHDLFRTL